MNILNMLRKLCLLLVFGLLPFTAAAEPPAGGHGFVAVALHDVADDSWALEDDAITTQRLIEFFDWLKGNGWTAISLDDVERAARGERPLPPRAILLTFDDGYRSLYTRVFPLLLAYRYPVLAALVGEWMEVPAGSQVIYNDRPTPRNRFISWSEAREMQASGLVEFAAHSHGLHTGIAANPQGNVIPSAVTRAYGGSGYENEAAQYQRLLDDARRARALLQHELGRAPRAWVWPYGRYSMIGIEAVRSAGFSHALTLDAGFGDARQPLAIPRAYPGADAKLGALAAMVRQQRALPAAQRLVCVDPQGLAGKDAKETDARLGAAIERLRRLGATAVVIDAVSTDAGGQLSAWFPTPLLPLRADLLSRISWQMQSRAGVETYIRLPAGTLRQKLGSDEAVSAVFNDMGAHVPASGLFIDDAPGLASLQPAAAGFTGQPALTRAARDGLDPALLPATEKLALLGFRAVQRHRPDLRMALLVDSIPAGGPGQLADLVLQRAAVDDDYFKPVTNRRSGLWLASAQPPAAPLLASAVRRHLIGGGSAIGWCADDAVGDRPRATEVSPEASASTFPVLF